MDAAGMSRGEDVRTRSLAETGGKERVRLFLEEIAECWGDF